MRRRSSKKKSSHKTGFADWLRSQFAPSSDARLDARRLRFETLEPRQLLSVAQANGPEFQVNTYTAHAQTQAKVAADPAGDYVAVWTSYPPTRNTSYGVYAQRYNVSGVAQGSEFEVSTSTNSRQVHPDVAMDSTGDFVVAWVTYNSGRQILAQRYNAAGAAVGSQIQVSSDTGSDNRPSIAMDSAGDFVVAWDSYGQDGSQEGVYAQRFNAAGTAQGSEFQVNTYTTSNQSSPTAAMDSAGDFVIAWMSNGPDGSGYGVYAQRYNAGGTAQGSNFLVNTYTTGAQWMPSAAMDATGDFVTLPGRAALRSWQRVWHLCAAVQRRGHGPWGS